MQKDKLFINILTEFKKAGILNNVILIGGWAYEVYRYYFKNPPELPLIHTVDIDFLIPRPPKIHTKVSVPELLSHFDFIRKIDILSGYEKFVHPDVEVEFLINDVGKGSSKPYKVSNLNIEAMPLRTLNILTSDTIKVNFNGIIVTVPHPACFVFHKLILSSRRKGKFKYKIENDIRGAVELGTFLMKNKQYQKKLINLYSTFSKKMKNIITNILIKNSIELFELIKNK